MLADLDIKVPRPAAASEARFARCATRAGLSARPGATG